MANHPSPLLTSGNSLTFWLNTGIYHRLHLERLVWTPLQLWIQSPPPPEVCVCLCMCAGGGGDGVRGWEKVFQPLNPPEHNYILIIKCPKRFFF